MIRESALVLSLLVVATAAHADTATSVPAAGDSPVATAPSPVESTPLPPMRYLTSLTGDDVFNTLRANPAFQMLDKDLPGSPLSMLVTHTVRPTPGGQAAGLLTAILSGSTLGLIPIVSSERMVLRYEVLLHGKSVATYQFERKAAKASNLWTMDAGLDKASLAWVKETAGEVATKAARDPALRALQQEIAYYFPAAMTPTAAPLPLVPPAPPAPPAAARK